MPFKKKYIALLFIVVLLITVRLLLPYFVKNYVNQVLEDIPGYYGQVEDIDISLIRGAYVINNLYLNKVDAGSQVPFLNFHKTDISIEWKSLFKGKIVSEIALTNPEIIYVFEDQNKENTEDPELEDWTKALTELVPININTLQVSNGKIAFVQLAANPNIDLQLYKINFNAKNLRNVLRTERELPSSIYAEAKSIGKGDVKLEGSMDLVKKVPDIDITFSLENADATSLNDLTNHYAGIDFKEGTYDVYSEIAIADSYLKGYIKPMLKDSKIISKEDSFLEVLWEGFVGFFKFVLKNHGNNTLATKIPFEGNLDDINTSVWITTKNIIKNAWIKAFKGTADNEIDFEEVQKKAKKQNK
ncbi:DUF748 domain-containing protein [Aquimarina algicola]|uniref:DUF748 domain-containing protein n=1 Tax=Aquimarina algicola TaxID=2589995 RepID=A0A504J769_9FLAO|nr:DUF748 domain-containing protein [Aquimarina algicola]TPN84455.1 DUF748 domain-containing protein [Aquimarina algicola]